jgi:hypothetical protein
LIQNYAANFNHSNKMRERNKGHPNWKKMSNCHCL